MNRSIRIVKRLFALLLLGSLAMGAKAHHSAAQINTQATKEFQGVVKEFRWTNPHTYIVVEQADAEGGPQQWKFETGAVPVLARSGWTVDSLEEGEVVTVRGYPNKDPARHYALLDWIEKKDGTRLSQWGLLAKGLDDEFPVSSEEAVGAGAPSLQGVWRSHGWIGEGYATMQLTEKGEQARDLYDATEDSPVFDCIGYPLVRNIVFEWYLNQIEINQQENTIVVRSEFLDGLRTIYMGQQHPENIEPSLSGHSIGRWDGDTLVVDTIGFIEHRSPYNNRSGIASGTQKHVQERYTLSEDGTTVIVDVRLEDPEYLAAPFEGQAKWTYRPDLEFHTYDCDSRNAMEHQS